MSDRELSHAAMVDDFLAGELIGFKWESYPQPVGDDGDEFCRLLGCVHILGVPHHFELTEVRDVPLGDTGYMVQEAVSTDTHFDQIVALTDGAMRTVRYHGREYVVAVFPYGN